jgi:phospholipid transport system substrate-binding protein
MMRFFVPALAVLLALAAPAPSRAADDPAGFVADLGQRTVRVLAAKVPEGEREAQFRALFNEGFDVPAISRFVLGNYWRVATEEQRRAFVTLFEA